MIMKARAGGVRARARLMDRKECYSRRVFFFFLFFFIFANGYPIGAVGSGRAATL